MKQLWNKLSKAGKFITIIVLWNLSLLCAILIGSHYENTKVEVQEGRGMGVIELEVGCQHYEEWGVDIRDLPYDSLIIRLVVDCDIGRFKSI